MGPFAIILASTLLGLTGAPWVWAAGCGVLLGFFGASTHVRIATPLDTQRSGQALALYSGASLAIAQATTLGAFAVGELLGTLL